MTLIRLFAVALLVCSTLVFAQTKTDTLAVSEQASASQPATASELWKFVPNQLADARSGKDPLNRLQVDKYKVSRSNTNTRTLLFGPDADAGMVLSGLGGDLDGVTTCLKIRSYVVARDSKDSDSTHPVSYSTCQPSTRYRVRTTEIRSGSVDR
ncbi:MAG TPA: hypothetical protein VIX37_11950 [Candidatus Sulfotelmatobacter sp.]